jgi:hypothetical protein
MSTAAQRRFAAQSARISDAYAKYVAATQRADAITQCPSWWPADGETRCDLLEGHWCPEPHIHDAACGGLHRHKPKGMAVGCITWKDDER